MKPRSSRNQFPFLFRGTNRNHHIRNRRPRQPEGGDKPPARLSFVEALWWGWFGRRWAGWCRFWPSTRLPPLPRPERCKLSIARLVAHKTSVPLQPTHCDAVTAGPASLHPAHQSAPFTSTFMQHRLSRPQTTLRVPPLTCRLLRKRLKWSICQRLQSAKRPS